MLFQLLCQLDYWRVVLNSYSAHIAPVGDENYFSQVEEQLCHSMTLLVLSLWYKTNYYKDAANIYQRIIYVSVSSYRLKLY